MRTEPTPNFGASPACPVGLAFANAREHLFVPAPAEAAIAQVSVGFPGSHSALHSGWSIRWRGVGVRDVCLIRTRDTLEKACAVHGEPARPRLRVPRHTKGGRA